jgi:GTP cyclohydrolase II
MLNEPDAISPSHLAAARAVDSLRRQLGIAIQGDGGAVPVEGVGEALLRQAKNPSLLLTAARAQSLGLGTEPVRIDARGLPLAALQALSDPLALATGLPQPVLLPTAASHPMLLTLAKYAALLPALLLLDNPPAEWPQLKISDIETYWRSPQLDLLPLVKAALPLEGAEQAEVICFRERYGTSVHLALLFGQPQDGALVRVHSSCLTGDILGSLRCDCGDQLKLATGALSEAGGILLYLHQEGRGIGIANKLRAYALQEQGHDTYEANALLGFAEDERDFTLAAALLGKLGVKRIRLLTNNPHKLAALEKAGIEVSQRVPLVAKPGAHNHGYLDAKAKKSGHLF